MAVPLSRSPLLRPPLSTLLGVLLAFVVAELVVRQVYFLSTGYDNTIGPQLEPGRVRYALEGVATSDWTEHGLRRKNPPNSAAPSLLVLGDSFTQALGVGDDDVFTHRLERKLGASDEPIQVLNAGRPGSSLADYVAVAPRYRGWYQTRWTVVQLRAPDFTDEAWQTRASYAHFARDEAGALTVVPAKVAQHSALWHRLMPLRRASMLLTFGTVRAREFSAAAADEPPLFRGATKHPTTKGATDDSGKWPIADELAALVKAYDGRVTIAYLPDFEPQSLDVTHPIERAVFDVCQKAKLSCVNLRAHFKAFAADHVSPYGFPNSSFNAGHMNELGHHALADDLALEISRLRAHAIF